MPGKLGTNFWTWIKSLDLIAWIRGVRQAQIARGKSLQPAWQNSILASVRAGQIGQALLTWAAGSFWIAFGDVVFHPQDIVPGGEEISDELKLFLDNPSVYTAEKLRSLGSAPATREITQTLGSLVMDPVLGLFESYATDPEPDIHEFSRSFHGYMMSLSWGGGVLSSILKPVLGDRTPDFPAMLSQMYWTLGLGFLGWQTLAPLLSAGLQPNLERYYSRLYRPTRFNPSQMSDLFALGERSGPEMREYLRDQGWQDKDIDSWIKLSYRTLPESGAWELYHRGEIFKDEMDKRLRSYGYDPADIPDLYKLNEKEVATDARTFTVSTAKAALKAKRIGETEFREILTALRYLPREIELLIQLLTVEKETEDRELSTSQIRQLYETRVIGRDEALHYLQQLRYTPQVAGQLVQAWDNESVPKVVRINKSTILEAFTDGVLTREETKAMLQAEAGYSAEQAEFLARVEETQRPTPTETPEVAAASLSLLAEFVLAGLITRAELAEREEIRRFSAEDQARIIDLMFLAPQVAVVEAELSGAVLESAYIHGVITRDVFLTRLVAFGLSEEDAEIAVRTVELERPDVFGEFRSFYLAQPSIGALQLALQRGMLDEAQFRARLEAQGYSQDAIQINLFNAQYQAPAEPRQLTKADVMSLYRKQIIGRAEAARRLIQIGYTTVDVELLIKAEGLAIEDTLASDFFIAGFLDATGFVALISAAGYTPEEIEDYFSRLEAGEIGQVGG